MALIQETHLKKKIYFSHYATSIKSQYGKIAPKGGLMIFYRQYLKDYVQEMMCSDQDIQIIRLLNIHIVNVYVRPDGR